MLALGLALYEATICPSCGQPLHLAMDDDLADEWTTTHPVRDHACTALERANEGIKGFDHPRALRIQPGLREGWEGRLEQARAERAAKAASEG